MYLLYLSSISFILYTIYRCIYVKNYKKFDYKKEYLFIIKNIEYIKNYNVIALVNYNYKIIKQKKYELINYLYDFYIVNYIYNGIEYKYTSDNNYLTFPIYNKLQIENYVYINKINKAILILNDVEEYNILNIILNLIGPNYNFYKDLNVKISIEKVLKYYYLKNENIFKKINFINKNYYIKLYDNFNNEYIITDYLTWDPNIHNKFNIE